MPVHRPSILGRTAWLPALAVLLAPLLAAPATAAVPVPDDRAGQMQRTAAPALDDPAEPTAEPAAEAVPDDVRAEMQQHWTDLGGADGPLGDAEGEPFAVPGGTRWNFTRGALLRADPPEGAPAVVSAVLGATLQRYDAYDGPAGVLGFPLADPEPLVGEPTAQRFEHGNIYTSSTGAHAVRGAILQRYLRLGGPTGSLGLPVSEQAAAGAPGSLRTNFQRGRIYWSRSTGAREVTGAILARYLHLHGADGRLGLPTTGEQPTSITGARRNAFEHGFVYWSAGTGAHEVLGAIARRYVQLHGAGGRLGLPTTGEQPTSTTGARRNAFQHGFVYWSAGTGAHEVLGLIARRYVDLRGAGGRMGLPTSHDWRVWDGRRQHFQRGDLQSSVRRSHAYIRLPFSARGERITAADVPYTWRPGCPVSPAGLRLLHVVHRNWSGDDVRGRLIVRSTVVTPIRTVFRRAHADGFRVRRMVPADRWHGSDAQAMAHDSTNAFNCRSVTGNPYRLSQHSYGNAIDINSFENPYVTSSNVYPAGSDTYLNRSWVRKGMIVSTGVVRRTFGSFGWPWGARWSHPDYQHFSSNGG